MWWSIAVKPALRSRRQKECESQELVRKKWSRKRTRKKWEEKITRSNEHFAQSCIAGI